MLLINTYTKKEMIYYSCLFFCSFLYFRHICTFIKSPTFFSFTWRKDFAIFLCRFNTLCLLAFCYFSISSVYFSFFCTKHLWKQKSFSKLWTIIFFCSSSSHPSKYYLKFFIFSVRLIFNFSSYSWGLLIWLW